MQLHSRSGGIVTDMENLNMDGHNILGPNLDQGAFAELGGVINELVTNAPAYISHGQAADESQLQQPMSSPKATAAGKTEKAFIS